MHINVTNCQHFIRYFSVKANFICRKELIDVIGVHFGLRDCYSLHVLQSADIREGTEVRRHSVSASADFKKI
jgi:hypothetical protein